MSLILTPTRITADKSLRGDYDLAESVGDIDMWYLARLTTGVLTVALIATPGAESHAAQLEASEVIRMPIGPRHGTASVVTALAVDGETKRIVAGGDDHLVTLWDLETSRLLARLVGHTDWIRDARFSSDGRYIATAGNDRRVIAQTCRR